MPTDFTALLLLVVLGTALLGLVSARQIERTQHIKLIQLEYNNAKWEHQCYKLQEVIDAQPNLAFRVESYFVEREEARKIAEEWREKALEYKKELQKIHAKTIQK